MLEQIQHQQQNNILTLVTCENSGVFILVVLRLFWNKCKTKTWWPQETPQKETSSTTTTKSFRVRQNSNSTDRTRPNGDEFVLQWKYGMAVTNIP